VIDLHPRTLDDPALYARLLKRAEEQVQSGLPGDECDRLGGAIANDDFYELRNLRYLEKREGETDYDYRMRPKRTVGLVREAVDKLTSKLYSPGPTRKLHADADPDVSQFLEGIYRDCHVDSLMQVADRRATLNDAAMIQAEATGDPRRPLKLYVYSAHEFCPFFADDEPVWPWAVCTISVEKPKPGKKRRRYDLYTPREIRTYRTKAIDATMGWSTNGGTRAELAGTRPNPLEMLPFCWVFHRLPNDAFWTGSLGTPLREANQELDRDLSDQTQLEQAFRCPDQWIKNVPTDFRHKKSPGRWQILRRLKDQDDKVGDPEPFYTQPTLDTASFWLGFINFANTVLQGLSVPLTAARTDSASGPTSALQILAEQIPLLTYTKQRQRPFTVYEHDLATLILAVCGRWYSQGQGEPEQLDYANRIALAAEDLKLDVTWPVPAVDFISIETLQADDEEYQLGITSRARILAKTHGLTIDQARQLLYQIAAERLEEQQLGLSAPPPPQFGPDGMPDPNAPPPPAQPGQPGSLVAPLPPPGEDEAREGDLPMAPAMDDADTAPTGIEEVGGDSFAPNAVINPSIARIRGY
jgi:hypothetical protein